MANPDARLYTISSMGTMNPRTRPDLLGRQNEKRRIAAQPQRPEPAPPPVRQPCRELAASSTPSRRPFDVRRRGQHQFLQPQRRGVVAMTRGAWSASPRACFARNPARVIDELSRKSVKRRCFQPCSLTAAVAWTRAHGGASSRFRSPLSHPRARRPNFFAPCSAICRGA